MAQHMKRITIPTSWTIPRKEYYWAVSPRAGPHPTQFCVPLLVVVRDMLELADNSREARMIIGSGKVLVDGKAVTDRKFPVGLMDVIEIPELKDIYRVMMDKRGKWVLTRIPKEESKFKLTKIIGKTTVKGGRTQLNLFDGRNVLLKADRYKVGDTLKIEVPKQKVVSHYPMQKGSLAFITSGAHIGQIARIEDIEITRDITDNTVRFEEGFSTVKRNVFVIGEKHPEVSTPQEVIA